MTTESYLLYKRARREQPWNPWGAMPARGSTQQEDDECERLCPTVFDDSLIRVNPEIRIPIRVRNTDTT